MLKSIFVFGLSTLLCYVAWYFTYWQRRGIRVKSFFDYKGYFVHYRDEYLDYINKNGKIYGSYRFFQKLLVVNDVKLISELLGKHADALHDHIELNTGSSIFSKSVTILMGEDWKRIRAITSPVFTATKLKQMVQPLSAVADTLIEELDKRVGTGVIDIQKFTDAYTMDALCACSYGNRMEGAYELFEKHPLLQNVRELMQNHLHWKVILNYTWPSLVRFLKIEPFNLEAEKYFVNKTFKIIDDHLEDDRLKRSHKTKDLTRLLLDSGQIQLKNGFIPNKQPGKCLTMTYEELASQIITFFLAADDTFAPVLCNAVYHMCRNPHTQELLYEELKNIEDFSYEVLTQLKYLNGVINETMRLTPSVILLARTASKDFDLGDSGIRVEKDMQIEIMTYALHRDPDIYEDPLSFKPERFIEPKHPPSAFLPFGGGARLCLGKYLAYNAMRMCLSKLVKNFEFTLAPGFELHYENNALFMKPEQVLVNIKRRK